MLLATHLAEMSVTIDDVVYVIDSGRFKVLFPSVARMNFGRNRVNVFTRNDGAVKVNPGIFTTCIPPQIFTSLDCILRNGPIECYFPS